MHGQLGGVKIVNAVLVDQLVPKGIISSDPVDLCSGIFSQLRHPLKGLLSPKSKIPSGNIKA